MCVYTRILLCTRTVWKSNATLKEKCIAKDGDTVYYRVAHSFSYLCTRFRNNQCGVCGHNHVTIRVTCVARYSPTVFGVDKKYWSDVVTRNVWWNSGSNEKTRANYHYLTVGDVMNQATVSASGAKRSKWVERERQRRATWGNLRREKRRTIDGCCRRKSRRFGRRRISDFPTQANTRCRVFVRKTNLPRRDIAHAFVARSRRRHCNRIVSGFGPV